MRSFCEQKKRSDHENIIERLQYMYVEARRQRYFKISCDTRIVDLTCLSAGRKEINAFAVGIFTSLVCSSMRRHVLTQ